MVANPYRPFVAETAQSMVQAVVPVFLVAARSRFSVIAASAVVGSAVGSVLMATVVQVEELPQFLVVAASAILGSVLQVAVTVSALSPRPWAVAAW